MNGRELFEIYAEEAALSHDSHRPYWDLLTGAKRDLWNRVAKRLAADDPLAGIEVYEVDGARYIQTQNIKAPEIKAKTLPVSGYTTETADGGPFGQPITPPRAFTTPTSGITDDYPLGPGRMQRFRRWASKFTWDSRR